MAKPILTREQVRKMAKDRLRGIKFGDPVTNVCAGDRNPTRLGYFVRRMGGDIECTDKKGKFWQPSAEVIFRGHIDYEECVELFHPIWEAFYPREAQERRRKQSNG